MPGGIADKIRRKMAVEAANLYLHSDWKHKFLVNLFTVRNGELDALFDRVFSLAVRKGFKINRPEVKQVLPGLKDRRRIRMKGVIGECQTMAVASLDDNLILVFSQAMKDYEDSVVSEIVMSVILAHELGHIVDYQTERKGHKLFDNIRHLDHETFADAFAAYLYSKLAVQMLVDLIPTPYFDPIRFAQLNLNCDDK